MQYMLLIYGNEGAWEEMKDHERNNHFMGYQKFTSDIKASKQFVAGDALQSIKTAKSDLGRLPKRFDFRPPNSEFDPPTN